MADTAAERQPPWVALRKRLPQNVSLGLPLKIKLPAIGRHGGALAVAVPLEGVLPPADSPLMPLLFVSMALNLWLLLRLRRRKVKRERAPVINGASTKGTSTALERVAQRRRDREARRSREEPTGISSLTGAVEKLEQLAADYQYAEAGELLDELNKAINSAGMFTWGVEEAKARLSKLLADGKLAERIRIAHEAAESLNNDDGFELVKEDETKRVLQRMTEDRHLTVKIEAMLEGVQPADCLQIWREASLYPTWFPFVSGGKFLADLHPGEVILHILVDTYFMSVDMCLWGWASDTLSTGGTFMLNVRPVRSHTRLPRGVALPRVDQTGAGKVFGALRAHAVIDVLLEPLGENSVRFAFQMSDHVPAFMPSWVINYIVQNAMADIFDKMHEVAVRMHSRDAKSPHVKHVNKASYKPVREWYARKMKSAESLWR